MGKHGFLSCVCRNLDRMEDELCDLRRCLCKKPREKECCHEKKGNRPRRRPENRHHSSGGCREDQEKSCSCSEK